MAVFTPDRFSGGTMDYPGVPCYIVYVHSTATELWDTVCPSVCLS
jgi:hypothetical protein